MRRTLFSPESISFQKDKSLFENIAKLIGTLRQVPEKELSNHEILQVLHKLILDKTGINTNIIVREDNHGMRVSIPMMNPNHTLYNEVRQFYATNSDLVRLMGPTDKSIRGTVNPKTGQIGGAFSKVVVDLTIPTSELKKDLFTDGELAAMLLHELGHIWSYFYYLGAVVRTSAIFEYLQRNLNEELDDAEREIVIVTAGKAAGMSDSELSQVKKVKGKQVLQFVIVSNLAEEIRSDVGENIYDHTTWEALSDEYAVRMGAGGELATGLDKLSRQGFARSYRGFAKYLLFEVVKFALLLTPGFNLFGISLMVLDGSSDYHDDPEARFRRIRNQFIEAQKDKSLRADEIKAYQQNILLMDDLLKDVTDRRQFISVIAEAIIPSLRKRKSVMDKVRILEQLATNELFNIAQQIKSNLQPV